MPKIDIRIQGTMPKNWAKLDEEVNGLDAGVHIVQ